jgi:hypothetical protein
MTEHKVTNWLIEQIESDKFCDHINGNKVWDKETLMEFLEQAREMEKSKHEAVKMFHQSMFSADMNANDFFAFATAQSVSIAEEDFDWILEHTEKYAYDGLYACLAYIQNMEPIKPNINYMFNQAINELIDRNQKVSGDVDWEFHHYNDDGPYRKINKI